MTNVEKGALFIVHDVLGYSPGQESHWDVLKITAANATTFTLAKNSAEYMVSTGNYRAAIGVALLGLGFETLRFYRRIRAERLWWEGMKNPVPVIRTIDDDGKKIQVISLAPGKKEKNGRD